MSERRKRIAAVLLGVVLALAVAEGVARTWLPPSHHHHLYQRSEDPVLGVDLRPGAELVFEGSWVPIPPTSVRISAQGLRDAPLDVPKAEDRQRLACVGDSTTFGWGVEVEETWCRRLAALLGPEWETVNLGVPGYNTEQEVRRLEAFGLPLEPDLVIVQHEEGDSAPPLDTQLVGSTRYHLLGRLGLARLLIGTVTKFEAAREEERAEATPEGVEATRQAFERLAELAWDHDFRVAVFTNNPLDPALPGAVDAGLPVESLLDAVPLTSEDLRIPGDGHWNAEGHRRVADLMIARLQNLGIVRP